jgi:hypothetical protein
MLYPHKTMKDAAAEYAEARRVWRLAREVALRDAPAAATTGRAEKRTVRLPYPDERGEMITFRSYATARTALVAELLKDAAAHDAGRFDDIGRLSDRMDLPRVGPPELTKLRVALSFWDGWTDARNRGWPPAGDIAKREWPLLARRIAADLAENREISDARISATFMSPSATREVKERRRAPRTHGARPRTVPRTALGVAYVVACISAATLPFVAFGPTGLFILLPTVLWLAPGLRTRVRRAGKLTDGVGGWPGLTTLVCAAASFAMMALGGHAMAAAWLGSLAACGLLELTRARVATADHVRAAFGPRGARRG